jgi:hypothetical protein
MPNADADRAILPGHRRHCSERMALDGAPARPEVSAAKL